MSSGTEKTTSKSQKLPNMKTEGKAIVWNITLKTKSLKNSHFTLLHTFIVEVT
jgi:hypothetical protein